MKSRVPVALVSAALLTLVAAAGVSAQSPSAEPAMSAMPAASCPPAMSSMAPVPLMSEAPGSSMAPASLAPASMAPATSMAPAPSGATASLDPCAGTQVSGSVTEMSITLDATTVPAGEVTFNVTNVGTVEHEFVIVATDLAQDQLPVEDGEVDEDEVDVVSEIEGLQPGKDGHLSVDLPAGHYVIFCNLPGHYLAGMHTEVTVQ